MPFDDREPLRSRLIQCDLNRGSLPDVRQVDREPINALWQIKVAGITGIVVKDAEGQLKNRAWLVPRRLRPGHKSGGPFQRVGCRDRGFTLGTWRLDRIVQRACWG